MTPYKTRKPKIVTVALRLAICLAFMLGIVFASPTFAVYAKGGTQIDTLGVAFGKVNVGDSLADAFEFENEAEGTLKVPSYNQNTQSSCGSKLYGNAPLHIQKRSDNNAVGKRQSVASVERS